jgi:uncharacterized protein Usg
MGLFKQSHKPGSSNFVTRFFLLAYQLACLFGRFLLYLLFWVRDLDGATPDHLFVFQKHFAPAVRLVGQRESEIQALHFVELFIIFIFGVAYQVIVHQV